MYYEAISKLRRPYFITLLRFTHTLILMLLTSSLYLIQIVPCIRKAFVPPVSNKTLINHVITTPTVTSAVACEIQCFIEVKCESYNFGPKDGGGHVCELSDSDVIRDPLDWITKQGFIYRGTEVYLFKIRTTKTLSILVLRVYIVIEFILFAISMLEPLCKSSVS